MISAAAREQAGERRLTCRTRSCETVLDASSRCPWSLIPQETVTALRTGNSRSLRERIRRPPGAAPRVALSSFCDWERRGPRKPSGHRLEGGATSFSVRRLRARQATERHRRSHFLCADDSRVASADGGCLVWAVVIELLPSIDRACRDAVPGSWASLRDPEWPPATSPPTPHSLGCGRICGDERGASLRAGRRGGGADDRPARAAQRDRRAPRRRRSARG